MLLEKYFKSKGFNPEGYYDNNNPEHKPFYNRYNKYYFDDLFYLDGHHIEITCYYPGDNRLNIKSDNIEDYKYFILSLLTNKFYEEYSGGIKYPIHITHNTFYGVLGCLPDWWDDAPKVKHIPKYCTSAYVTKEQLEDFLNIIDNVELNI